MPKLPDELLATITSKPRTPPPATTREIAPRVEPALAPTTQTTPTAAELQDIWASYCCLPISQFDKYSTWIRVGMILKKLGAPPLSLWKDVSKRSNKYKLGDCSKRWPTFHTQFFSIGSLFVLAKEGNLETL